MNGLVCSARPSAGICPSGSLGRRAGAALHSRRGAFSTGSAPQPTTESATPDPEVFGVIDPRPFMDDAAIIAARYGGTGWLIAETRAAGLALGNQLWFGFDANIGVVVRRGADELGIAIQVIDQN